MMIYNLVINVKMNKIINMRVLIQTTIKMLKQQKNKVLFNNNISNNRNNKMNHNVQIMTLMKHKKIQK